MADHSLPGLTTPYATFLSALSGRIADLMLANDPANTTVTNPPTGTVRWNSVSAKWEKWGGAAWGNLATLYGISISGNAATATTAGAVPWGGITGKPTTIAGYAITDAAPLLSPALTGTPTSGGIEIGYRVIPGIAQVSPAGILARGKMYILTAAQQIPASVFAQGDAFSGYNNSAGSIVITQGAGLTLRLAGTASTGTRTLAQRGQYFIWFNSATEAVISGTGLT